MQVSAPTRWNGVLAALLAATAGCRSSAPAAADAGSPLVEAQGSPAPAEPAPAPAAPAPRAQAPEPRPPPAGASGAEPIRVGMARERLLATLGPCALRTLIIPGRSQKTRTVEYFQPLGRECLQRFGEVRFVVVAGRLQNIAPGIDDPPPRPAQAPVDPYRPQ